MVVKEHCIVSNDFIKGCPGLCCRYCPKEKNCGYKCLRIAPEECRYLISKIEYKWRKILGTMDKGVLDS